MPNTPEFYPEAKSCRPQVKTSTKNPKIFSASHNGLLHNPKTPRALGLE